MSELRYDALRDGWVIIAPDRGGRPRDIGLAREFVTARPCPFCPGEEAQTPPEIVATGRPAGFAANRSPWRVRVFPNRYPALVPRAAVPAPDAPDLATGWPGHGHHEVVVFTPEHGASLADLAPVHVAEILRVVRDRVAVLEAMPGIVSVLFFVNAGAGAGATLAHAHGQIIATPVVPTVVRQEVRALATWRAQQGRCLFCDLAAQEEANAARVVAASPCWLALAPWASRFPWEVVLVPRSHAAHVAAASGAELEDLGGMIVSVLLALRAAAGDHAYNLVLHTGPVGGAADGFHWHLEVLPRLVPMAGFETGSGFFINPLAPATAAAHLRDALAELRGGKAET